MKLLRNLRRFWVGPYKEIRRPAFPVCTELEARANAIRLREKLGDPKPLRILENPDYEYDWPRDGNGSPVDFEDLPV